MNPAGKLTELYDADNLLSGQNSFVKEKVDKLAKEMDTKKLLEGNRVNPEGGINVRSPKATDGPLNRFGDQLSQGNPIGQKSMKEQISKSAKAPPPEPIAPKGK